MIVELYFKAEINLDELKGVFAENWKIILLELDKNIERIHLEEKEITYLKYSTILDEDTKNRRGFFQRISFYFDKNICKKLNIEDDLSLAILMNLFLKKEIIISDDDVNPFTWILLSENNEVYKVSQANDLMEYLVIDYNTKVLLNNI